MSVKSVDQLRDNLHSLSKTVANEYDEGDCIQDNIFESIDIWFQRNIGSGRISNMSTYPKTSRDRDNLMTICNLLELADQDAWVTDDSGLWEGLDGQQVLFSQAFYSAENLLREYLPDELTD